MTAGRRVADREVEANFLAVEALEREEEDVALPGAQVVLDGLRVDDAMWHGGWWFFRRA